MQHMEGDTDVDEYYDPDKDTCTKEEIPEPDIFEKRKKVIKRPGPTRNAHHQEVEKEQYYFIPSSDEGSGKTFLDWYRISKI